MFSDVLLCSKLASIYRLTARESLHCIVLNALKVTKLLAMLYRLHISSFIFLELRYI